VARTRLSLCIPPLFLLLSLPSATQTHDDLTLLQNSSGWEYLTITDKDNGFPTQHVCFNTQETGTCRGKLVLGRDNKFVQSVSVHGNSLVRHGTYQLTGNQITFLDEFGNKDGPYSWTLNPDAKSLVIETTQAGVGIRMNLLLESEFHKRLEEEKKKAKQP
jgi:hypothetical protein